MKLHRRSIVDISTSFSEHLTDDYARKVLFRLIFGMRKVAEESFRSSYKQSPLYNFIGIDSNAVENAKDAQTFKAILWKKLEQRLNELVAQPKLQDRSTLSKNIQLLGKHLGLTKIDNKILRLLTVLATNIPFKEAIRAFELSCGTEQLNDVLSLMLDIPRAKIAKALAINGLLRATGLVKLASGIETIEDKILLSSRLADVLLSRHANAQTMLSCFFQKAQKADLTINDFSHLNKEIELLVPLLRNALTKRVPGVNILIYGFPGIGKTQFARLLSQEVGANLFEVNCADNEGEVLEGNQRFSAYQLCQSMLTDSNNSMVLFDEIEDVFPNSLGSFMMKLTGERKQQAVNGKAWVNRVLESNPVPAIWIGNEVSGVDAAYLRRFSFSLDFPRPIRAVRRAIIERHFTGCPVSNSWLDQLAENTELTPGQIDMAARIMKLSEPSSIDEAEDMAEAILNGSMQAIHGSTLPRIRRNTFPYRLGCVSAQPEPAEIVAGLQHHRHATLCFYGPPGTGKTALARHIAEQLNQPLIIKTASDLMSKWIGEAEKNIASMFVEAERENAVLLLDEADSFLSDRRNVGHRWELTETNELLTRMEEFDGIFICTTNFLEQLDPAALRRFSFKVRFDYANQQQRQTLFADLLAGFGVVNIASNELAQLEQMDRLTPGDFAAVAKQYQARTTKPDAPTLLKALQAECNLKGDKQAKIGFTN